LKKKLFLSFQVRKRIGRSITKKEDQGYELVFDILLGIRNTVSRTEAKHIPDKALQSEFNAVTKERYPSQGFGEEKESVLVL
jgi:hypothetical protein